MPPWQLHHLQRITGCYRLRHVHRHDPAHRHPWQHFEASAKPVGPVPLHQRITSHRLRRAHFHDIMRIYPLRVFVFG
jgi:hypothetical protein